MQQPKIEEIVGSIKSTLSASNVEPTSLDEIGFGLAWTESYFNRGYELLKRHPRASYFHIAASESPAAISGDGAAIHFLIPKIVNYLVAGTAPNGTSRLGVTDLTGGWMSPYLAFRLAQNHHHAAIYWRPPAVAEKGEAPATLVLAASALDGEVQPMLITPGEAWGGGRRDKLLVGQVPLELVAGLHEILRPLADATESVLAIVTAPDSMDAELSEESIPIADVLDSFGFAGHAPDLLDVTSAGRLVA